MNNDYLAHHGIKGMKWGRRRYQNADGSLTPAGRKRYRTDASLHEPVDSTKIGVGKVMTEKDGYAESGHKIGREIEMNSNIDKDIREAQNIARNANDIARVAQSASKKTPSKTKEKMDLSDMSDQELRTEINRALLEKQYNDVFAPEQVNKGKERFEKFLDGTMTTLQITSSALGIALAIRSIMKQ